MPASMATTVSKIGQLQNETNSALIREYLAFMTEKGSSENHKNNTIKVAISFASFLGGKSFFDVNAKDEILVFLDTKMKSPEDDPEKKWITTWNHNLARLKMFFRWLYNVRLKTNEGHEETFWTDWETPAFLKIKEKRTKRLSPYSETEIWDRDELLCIVKYEPRKRYKAALTLFWDLDARNHEVTLLRIKNIRLKDKYGEGEIPAEAKTGSGPILLTCSFPYVRDWLNEHPFRNNPEARVICSVYNGAPVRPDAMWLMLKQLRRRIVKLVESGTIKDAQERQRLEFLLRTKKWNPYCLRHSAITADSDFLPEYALKKKVRWSMNSKQGSRYIKRTMGNDLKREILARSGIVSDDAELRQKPAVLNCPRCSFVNALEYKFCSKCSYTLTVDAYEECKAEEQTQLDTVEARLKGIENLLLASQPLLKNIKPELLPLLGIHEQGPGKG